MTIQRMTYFSPGGDGPGSDLTRLRMADEIFTSRDDSRHGASAGFITIQQGEADPWPRPTGPTGQFGRTAARRVA